MFLIGCFLFKLLGTLGTNLLQEVHGLSVISNNQCESIYKKRIGVAVLNCTFPSGFTNDFICAVLPEGIRGNCGVSVLYVL